MNLISSCFLEIKHLSPSFPQVRLRLAVFMSLFQIPQSHAKCIADPTFSEKKCTKIYMNVERKNLLPCCKLSSCTRDGLHFHAEQVQFMSSPNWSDISVTAISNEAFVFQFYLVGIRTNSVMFFQHNCNIFNIKQKHHTDQNSEKNRKFTQN